MSVSRDELQDAARRAFGDAGLAADPAATWSLVAELGFLMLGVPEERGGLGLGGEAAGVVHAELGRALVRGPGIAQLLAITALAAADDLPERDDLLARAMAGEVMTASLSPGGGLRCVPDADRASQVLAVATDRIALVPLDAPGVTLAARPTWDETRRLFDVTVPTDEGLAIAGGNAAAALAERLEAQLLLALAGDSLGGAAAVLEMSVEYLKTRRQFDRPLAMFQALKHRCADMRTWIAAAEALFWQRSRDEAPPRVAAGAVKAHATTVYRRVAEEAIQLHGGIGLTMEHPCHLFLKRAMLNAALGGDNDFWEEQAGRAALAPG